MPFTPVTFTDGVTPLNKATFDGVQAGVIAAERTENKGAASGYASLDSGTKVPLAQIPVLTSAQLPAPTAVSPTPPGSPVDGQLWFYQPVAGVTWVFRYNSGSGSAYKWEFVGGPPLLNSSATIDSVTGGGAWIDDARVTFTGLRSGDYLVTYDAYWNVVPAAQNSIGVSGVSGNTAPASDAVRSFQGTLTLMSATVIARVTGVSAIYGKLYSAGTSGTVAFRTLSAIPVRVA